MKTEKILIGMMAFFVSISSILAHTPTISNVTVKQRWPWSQLVDIDYVLTCDSDQVIDITIEAYDSSSRLILPVDSFSGDVTGVSCGARRIIWDPRKTSYADKGVLPEFRVELIPTPIPLYVIVDLNKSVGEEGQTEYVYEADLTNGLWGTWVRNPVTNESAVVQSVVWTGVTTNDIYKTDKIVLRRIPAGTFTLGSAKVKVTLSRGFYAGVYQVTQDQWEKLMGTNPASPKGPFKPVNAVSYDTVRGATNDVPEIDWPRTGSSVFPSSFLGRLREKTKKTGFDLPTEAQWEYFCKAGTTTYYNDGISSSSTNTNELNQLGWWSGNSGGVLQPVGQKAPNAWGLYDTHGNVRELCLDWYDTLVGGVDPAGPVVPVVKPWRVLRNGAYSQAASSQSSINRWRDPPDFWHSITGFRLVMNLQAY